MLSVICFPRFENHKILFLKVHTKGIASMFFFVNFYYTFLLFIFISNEECCGWVDAFDFIEY